MRLAKLNELETAGPDRADFVAVDVDEKIVHPASLVSIPSALSVLRASSTERHRATV